MTRFFLILQTIRYHLVAGHLQLITAKIRKLKGNQSVNMYSEG